MNKILFATDFSENAQNAFQWAIQYASMTRSAIDVLHVVFPEVEAMDVPVLSANATLKREEVAKEVIKQFIQKATEGSGNVLVETPPIGAKVTIGQIVSTILNVAKDEKYDLIILSTRGDNQSRMDRLFGTVSTRIASHAPCPVLLIPAEFEFEPLEQIAYASDLKGVDPFEIWRAVKLFKPYNPIVRIVHVCEKFNEEESEKFQELKDYMQGHFDGLQIVFHELQSKNVEERIRKFIDNYNIDVLVTYKMHDSYLRKLFGSSITKKMISHLKLPLLVMNG